MLVAVGHHGPTTVPPALADDVHLGGEEGVGVADDGADVEVVLPVLDRDVETVPALVEIGDDCVAAQVAISVDDVAAVALGEQLGVIVVAGGPRAGPRADADLGVLFRHGRSRYGWTVGECGAGSRALRTACTASGATAARGRSATPGGGRNERRGPPRHPPPTLC